MLYYPKFNPTAFSIGPIDVQWYGLMYLFGILGGWALARWRSKSEMCPINATQVDDLVFYVALGVILGGRVGYVLIYDLPTFIQEPWSLFMMWRGGMSFHGGLVGVLIAFGWFAKRVGLSFWQIADFAAPMVPIGLGLGRLGNFINAELWGKPSDVPWAMVFPTGGAVARHPSQLYQFFLEGVVLFTVLWIYSAKPRHRRAVSGLFLFLYGIFRIFVEFYRVPDPQFGYFAFGWLTMGQILSVPMVILGGYWFFKKSEGLAWKHI